MNYDVIVLGAGIVGVSTALQLQARGRSVCLVDKLAPGEGTSFGNAGLIERSSVIPYAFPRSLTKLIRYALNRESDVHYQFSYLPKIAPWLFSYWWHSSKKGIAKAAAAMLPLIERCVIEHDVLSTKAQMQPLINDKGWIEIFRDSKVFEHAKQQAAQLAKPPYLLQYDVLTTQQFRQLEPAFNDNVKGAIHWLQPKTVCDPCALTKGYAALFVKQGGILMKQSVIGLTAVENLWQVKLSATNLLAKQIVIALGADSADLLRTLGYKVPLGVKRGYHRHYAMTSDNKLNRPVCDHLAGFIIAPMTKGVRLTTGAEFSWDSSPANDIQLKRDEAIISSYYHLGKPIESIPWFGRRPCLPDMVPVISELPYHKGIWANFGHAHHGLTLAPATGRLLAEMMTDEKPFTNPTPYKIERFIH